MRRYSHDSSAPRHLRRLVDAGKRDDLDPLRRARVAASLGLVPATAMALPSRPPPSPTLPPASGAIGRAMPRTVLGGIVIASVAVLGAGSWVSRQVVSRESGQAAPGQEASTTPSPAANPVTPVNPVPFGLERAGEAPAKVPAKASVLPLEAIADGPKPAEAAGEARANALLDPPSIDVSDLPAAGAVTAPEANTHAASGHAEARGASTRGGAQGVLSGEPSDARVARGSDRRAAARGSDARIAEKGATDTRVPSTNTGTNTGADVGEKSAASGPNGPGVSPAVTSGVAPNIAPSIAPTIAPTIAKGTAKAGSKDPAKDPTKDVAKDTTNAGDLREELAALDNVRRKTASGDPPAALALLDTYEKRFPTGKLREEALVLRIEALAANGQRESAERLAKTLFAASPNTPYATRVRAAVGRRSEEQQ